MIELLFVCLMQWQSPVDFDNVLFTSKRTGNNEIYLLKDGETHRLTNTRAQNRRAKWSPDKRQILFYSSRINGKYDLYLMKPDGSDQQQLTTDPRNDSGGAWSPDGKTIYFHSDRTGDDELYSMDLKTKELTRLTDVRGLDWRPEVSPDGKTLVFSSERDGNEEVYKLDLKSGEQTRLTKARGRDGWVSFSPKGDLILFHSERDGQSEMYTMRPDGSEQTRLTNFEFDGFFGTFAQQNGQLGIMYASEHRNHNDWDILWMPLGEKGAKPIKIIDGRARDYQPSL